ncbi:MAG: hypothetical protein LBB51_00870 [Zoogloeaceae bacterium]|nr:hypothetical protein [Zoogloeaceae bacterium]
MDETAKARLMKKLQTVKSEVQTRAASGWYSSDKVDVFLLDNGLFFYSLALGIAGRGYQFSWNGTWKEAAKDQVCLTMSPPEIVLFGRLDTEKALDPKQLMRDVIHLNMDEHSKEYSANVFLSRKTGVREELPEDFARFGSYWDDSVNWTDYRGGISEHMKADTSFLWSALLDETDLSNKSQMRVYRHALDPRYNDYVLMVKNPGLTGFSHEDDFPEDMIASAMLLMALLKKDTVKVQGTSLCGVMDDKRLERHEFSLEDRIYYEKMLEANERLPRIWQNGKSWMRIPAEDLGLRTLNIPESAD